MQVTVRREKKRKGQGLLQKCHSKEQKEDNPWKKLTLFPCTLLPSFTAHTLVQFWVGK